MGNQHSVAKDRHFELDHPEAVYAPNDIVSGKVLHLQRRKAFVSLTGIVHFEKHKKKHVKIRRIIFFSTTFDLTSSSNFQLHLDEHLPPSFNRLNTFPNISYSINLVYSESKDRIHSSIPIRVCPIIQIDQPLLLKPCFFGPIENPNYGTKLEIKIPRSVFTFDDVIQIYYQLQNQHEEYIHKIEVYLGIYYLIESNVWQEDISNSLDNFHNISSKQKLIRNKVILNIPNKISLPPTFKFKYDPKDDQSLFNLTIDYKIEFKIYLGNSQNLWQVDVPIVLCNQLLGLTDVSQTSEANIDIIE